MTVRIFQLRNCFKFESISFGNSLGKRWTSQYSLTSPIFYVNAEPHIGHLYTVTIGDVIARYQKLKNPSARIKYMVGTDEHGLKVSKSANEMNLDVQSFCDKISGKYKSLFDSFNIESHDFVRTTEERHCETVAAIWNQIASRNLIYKGEYSGWYCLSDEVFVSENFLEPEVKENDVRYTLEGKKPVQYVTEINYKFKLSQFQNDLLHWLDTGLVVKPKIFQDILRKWIVDGEVVKDISLSRPAARVSWGIPVPGDPSQTIYVWFDALSSYLTTNGYPNLNFKWPPDVQIIGKDILRFHGVFWPAFLMAIGLEPPKCILCHSHWIKDGEKISKSKGNIIDPFEEAKKYTTDGVRYFLIREGVPHSDGNFTDVKASAILNSELADTLGNLLCRCTGSKINENQEFPGIAEEDLKKYGSQYSDNLMNSLTELSGTVQTHFEEFNFYKGIDAIIANLHMTNRFFDMEKPWALRKSPEKRNHLNFVLHLTMESLRVCGILLQAVIPNIAGNLLDNLSIEKNKRSLRDIKPFSWESVDRSPSSKLPSEQVILFPKMKATG